MLIAQYLQASVVHILSVWVQHYQCLKIMQCNAKQLAQKRKQEELCRGLDQVDPDNPPPQIHEVWIQHMSNFCKRL